MCLTIIRRAGVVASTEDKKPKPRLAGRNIRVFKMLEHDADGGLVSPFLCTGYKLGETKKVPKLTPVADGIYYEVEAGLHAYRKRKTRPSFGQYFDAIIPKGSKYFLGTRNDIVATKLTLLDSPSNRRKLKGMSL